MIKKLRDLISNFSEKTEDADIQDISDLDNACAALLVETAFADKDFNESEQDSLKKSLLECYKISEEDINEIIEDAEITVKESTSLYGYTRIVNDKFEYPNKLNLLKNMWKIAYADGSLDKYEEHLIRKTSDLIHISHSDYIKIKLEVRDD